LFSVETASENGNPFLPNRVGSKCHLYLLETFRAYNTHKQPFETSPFKVFKEFFVCINMLHDQYFIFLSQLEADPHAGIISFSASLWSPLTLSPHTSFFFYYARRGSRIVCLKEEGLN
jgi:hypothetical protein